MSHDPSPGSLPAGALPPDTPQAVIQRLLEERHRRDGLPEAMAELFAFELAAGYLTREKLEQVERLAFPDPETGLSFRIQVNFARSRYQASAPPAGSAQGDATQSAPACLLCRSNIGRPGKEYLRVYEFPLRGRPFFLQLTPFPLFPYHFVLILSEHRRQIIDRQTLPDMFAFLGQAQGYTVCSNSDVEWAGSSILDHLHFQVFRGLRLPVMDARGVPGLSAELGGCTVEVLAYPLSALRLTSGSAASVQETGSRLIELWKGQDPGRNTVNLVLARSGEPEGLYSLAVLLRNPDYRTPPELQRFKSEGVGVIEASGEAILPVPQGDDAGELWTHIREGGLGIVKGIIQGNSPEVGPARMSKLLEALELAGPGPAY